MTSQTAAGRAGIIVCALWLSATGLFSQTAVSNKAHIEARSGPEADISATRVQMTALRDRFVSSASHAAGTCPIAPPKILIEDVPSFGSYDPDTNTLRISAWSLLKPEEKSIFYQSPESHITDLQAREDFESGVHHWVVVHELGHWWQACRGIKDSGKHYDMESGANRIAAAYWQENDPAVIAHQRTVFEAMLKRWPNPVPKGSSAKSYFDANYEKLGPTPAYIWFQARMCVNAFDEKPTPSFAQVLQQTKP